MLSEWTEASRDGERQQQRKTTGFVEDSVGGGAEPERAALAAAGLRLVRTVATKNERNKGTDSTVGGRDWSAVFFKKNCHSVSGIDHILSYPIISYTHVLLCRLNVARRCCHDFGTALFVCLPTPPPPPGSAKEEETSTGI